MAYTGAYVFGDSLVDCGNALKLAQWYGSLPFTAIPELIAAAMAEYEARSRRDVRSVEDVRMVDEETRRFAAARARGLKSKVL